MKEETIVYLEKASLTRVDAERKENHAKRKKQRKRRIEKQREKEKLKGINRKNDERPEKNNKNQ